MKFFHELKNNEIHLAKAIDGHSADKSIIYKKVDGEPIYLGYYFPKNYDRMRKYPMFVFIHGGGWASHKIFDDQTHWQGDYLGYLARYYADRGFLCVSIDYRLIKDNGQTAGYELIDSYEDCCDAIDYIQQHADEYGADIHNMYLLGESAGGHLAGAVAAFHYDRCYSFEKVFLVNAITELDEKWNRSVPKQSAHSRLAALDFDECAKFLSPIYHVDHRMGEVVLIHGEADTCVSLKHSEKFYHRMCELSKKCELHVIEKTNHAFLLAEYTKEIVACKVAIEIINKSLEKS